MRQSKGKGGEATVVAKADFCGERLAPQKHTGGAAVQRLFSYFKIIDGTFQTKRDIEKELSADKGRCSPDFFFDIETVHTMNKRCEIAASRDRQRVDIFIRHHNPKFNRTPWGDYTSGEAGLRSFCGIDCPT